MLCAVIGQGSTCHGTLYMLKINYEVVAFLCFIDTGCSHTKKKKKKKNKKAIVHWELTVSCQAGVIYTWVYSNPIDAKNLGDLV